MLTHSPLTHNENDKPVHPGERLRHLLGHFSSLKQKHQPTSRCTNHDPLAEPDWVLDAECDTLYALPTAAYFSDTLMIFTQQWVGIRAATGSFPARKLAVSKDTSWSLAEFRRIFDLVQRLGIKRLIAQGGSTATLDLLVALRSEMPELVIVGVWHGTLAAWSSDEERQLSSRFLQLADVGVFDRIALLCSGMHLLNRRAVSYLVPNMPPTVSVARLRKPIDAKPASSLFASWNNHWKNMYTNLVGASASSAIGRVYSYADGHLPGELAEKVQKLDYRGRRENFIQMSLVDIVLNVSIVDCHPMIELEALAVGTPVLRGQLDLDFGEDHDFARTMTVASALDASAIRNRIDYVSGITPGELSEMTEDYRRLVAATSLERYGRLLSEARQ